MSLDTLRQNLVNEAAGGSMTINEAAFTAAGLTAPDKLDENLKKAFVDMPETGLSIETDASSIGPISGDAFHVKGRIAVAIAAGNTVDVEFSATKNDGAVVVGIDLGADWTLGKSFLPLSGNTFAELSIADAWFFFAGQAEAAYPWKGGDVALVPGLNLAGDLGFSSYLDTATKLLPGLSPSPSYTLVGAIDPSLTMNEIEGRTVYGPPGLDLTTPPLAGGSFDIGHLSVEAPHVDITMVDLGGDMGLVPTVFIATRLQLPDDDKPPEFRVGLTAGKTSMAAFELVNPIDDEVALTFDQLFYLMGGSTFYSFLPPQLIRFLQAFGFESFGVLVDYGDGLSVSAIEVIITSTEPWVVLEDPHLSLVLRLSWTINSPLQEESEQYALLEATAKFLPDLFPGDLKFSIDTNLVVRGGYFADDESEYIRFTRLVAEITNDRISINPDWFELEFQEFHFTIDQPRRFYSIGATTSLKLGIFGDGNFELNNVALQLDVQKPTPQESTASGRPALPPGASRRPGSCEGAEPRLPAPAPPGGFPYVLDADGTIYSGSITGDVKIGPLYLVVDARYASEIWRFNMKMQPGTTLSLQGLIDAVFETFALPKDIFDTNIEISGVDLGAVVPSDPNAASEYTAAATFHWYFKIGGVLEVDALANLQLAYNSKLPRPYSGKVSATTDVKLFGPGATFTVEYEMVNNPETNKPEDIVRLMWEGLVFEYRMAEEQREITFKADDTWNLGRLITSLVRLVSPSSSRELPPPWNLLNDVSLGGMEIKFNIDTKEVTAKFPLNINLFFANIKSFNISKKPSEQVEVSISGDFFFTNDEDLSWDAVNEDPPEVPGGGDSAFDLRLLALGQRVTVPDLAKIDTINDAVNQLAGFETPPPTSRKIPIFPAKDPGTAVLVPGGDEPLAPRFSADSNWLIGTHFLAVSNTLDLKLIFNDPVLYGLRIGLAGEKAKIFAGLEFEIMYKKITDSVGMYRIQLKLPDAIRQLQFGAVTIILPIVIIEIYTNGNFKIDFGFPHNMDFTVSFTLQVFPFTGSGGFYFGILDGNTSSQVPKDTTCGQFKPVVEFGLGLQVGLGKSFSAGILKAEISVNVFGIIEGVVATWRAYDDERETAVALRDPEGRLRLYSRSGHELAVAEGNPDVEKQYYYKITGTVGIIGKVVGSIDFAIIKAEVLLVVHAYVKGTFEAYRETFLEMEAGVKVSVKVTINLGIFKISISLSFSIQIRLEFVLGSDRRSEAPWACNGTAKYRLSTPDTQRLRPSPLEIAAAFAEPNFAPLARPSYGPLPLDVFFMPQISIAEGGTGARDEQVGVCSLNLFISRDTTTHQGQTYESFKRLARDVFLWISASFSGRATRGTPDEELGQPTTWADMRAAELFFGANSDGRSLRYSEVEKFFEALFMVDLELPPAQTSIDASENVPDATAFPMPPKLTLSVTYKGQSVADRDFDTWATADQDYLDDLQDKIAALLAAMLDELEKKHDEGAAVRALLRRDAVAKQSLAQFMFVDFFAMLAQSLVRGALDAFDTYAYTLQAGDKIESIRDAFNSTGNELTVAQIAWANREHALSGGLALTIDDVPYPIQTTDTWGGIASSHGLDPAAVATENKDVRMVLKPGEPITIDQVPHSVPNSGSLADTAALFDLDAGQFGAAITEMQGILSPLTVLTLNGLAYTTADGGADSIRSLAESFGVEVPTLTPSITGVADLFDASADPTLLLPGLTVLPNRDVWDDIVGASGVEHLAGMVARYLLGGLRLPTKGIDFSAGASPCGATQTCGLQDVTGQQFPLPSLTGYDPADPLRITLTNPGLSWLGFTDFVHDVDATGANQINELVTYARTTGLQPPIDSIGPEPLASASPRRYTFKSDIVLQEAQPIVLPGGALPAGTTPRPRLWQFSSALASQLARKVDLAPAFDVEIGSTDSKGGRMKPSPAQAAAFGTLLNVAIKRPDAAVGSAETTYELVGADERSINLLERLLGKVKPTDASPIDGIYILYAPNATSDRAEGLQYDGEANYASFLVRGNLSTETNPPATPGARNRIADADEPRGLLNTPYEFVSLLWEGSIVRSGGYYFSYVLPGGGGLPDAVFSEDGSAVVSVLVVYGPGQAPGGTPLKDFMNVAVVDDPIDDANNVVFAVFQPRRASVALTAETRLSDIAANYHSGVVYIAEQNAARALSTAVTIQVTDVFHEMARGETLAEVAAFFGTTEDAIKELNPDVDFGELHPGVGLHIPDVTTQPAATTPGLTLRDIATICDTNVAALAWANRDVAGLFDPKDGHPSGPDVPLDFEDRLRDVASALPPGNFGVAIKRKKPGEDTAKPAVYLEQQYNLMGYDLVSNTDFQTISDGLPLPSSPTEEMDEEELTLPKRLAPAEPDPDARWWKYHFIVPAARAARNNSVPDGDDHPPKAMNPYAGVGGAVQLSLGWRDMMGNRAWSVFDELAPCTDYPLDRAASRVGFDDDVLGLGQWASTISDHYFADGGSLVIEVTFDSSRYERREDNDWETNADADRQVFANLYYQLVQTNRAGELATEIATTCSLDGGFAVAVTADERAALTAYVLAAWRYVNTLLTAGDPLRADPPEPKPVSVKRAIDAARVPPICAIEVALRLERRIDTVLPEFRGQPASRFADTSVGARMTKSTAESGFTIDWYTAQFAQAFDRPSFALKLASGTPRKDLGAFAGSETLWSFRVGKESGEAYRFEIDGPAAFFAPAPLSTTLLSRQNVSLYSYDPDTGLSPEPDVVDSISGVDLDSLARKALAAIDSLLEPRMAVPAFLVDKLAGTTSLEHVLYAKYKLARAIADGVTNVLERPALDPVANKPNFDAAREKLRQQLLIRLSNAYAIDAVVQHPLSGDSSAGGEYPPQLYGSPKETGVDQGAEASGYRTSSFKIPMTDETPLLTYTFATKEAHRQRNVPIEFDYRPTEVEHQIGKVPGIDEYKASSWLRFLDRAEPIRESGASGEAGVHVRIPIPLRAYPTPPSVVNQGFYGMLATEDPTATLEAAKQWTFCVVYAQSHAAQDRIDAVVRFNVPDATGRRFAEADEPDLFVMLARINHVVAAIQATLEQDLIGVKVESDPASADFQRAQKALAAVATLVKNIGAKWKTWVKPESQQARACDLLTGALDEALPFSVREDLVTVEYTEGGERKEETALRVSVAYPAGLIEGMTEPPMVVFPGFTPEEVTPDDERIDREGRGNADEDVTTTLRAMFARTQPEMDPHELIETKAWIYRRDEPAGEPPAKEELPPYLTWEAALNMPDREAVITDLDVIQFQNAWAQLQIVRNAELVGPGNPTRPPFVYTTPEVKFKSKLTPLLDTGVDIDIAKIPSGQPEKRKLQDHVQNLFRTFFAGSPLKEQFVKLEISYRYSLSEDEEALSVELPVLLFTPHEFEIPDSWQAVGDDGEPTPAATYIKAVADDVSTWWGVKTPSTAKGRFRFDLTAFSSLDTNTQPLVRVRNLVLAVDDVVNLAAVSLGAT